MSTQKRYNTFLFHKAHFENRQIPSRPSLLVNQIFFDSATSLPSKLRLRRQTTQNRKERKTKTKSIEMSKDIEVYF